MMKGEKTLLPLVVIVTTVTICVTEGTVKIENMHTLHYNCRNNIYKGVTDQVARFYVPDDKVPWQIKWPEYKPKEFTDTSLKFQTFTDPEIEGTSHKIRFNSIDHHMNRISILGNYTVVDSYPLNPLGRTGLRGRGVLPRWGPNHTVLVIITRWKSLLKKTAQYVGVQYTSGNETYWGLFGDFFGSGESANSFLKQKYFERIKLSVNISNSDLEFLSTLLDVNSKNGSVIFQGYQDNHVNTDNAWVEMVIKHFHDETNSKCRHLQEGHPVNNILAPCWVDIHRNIPSQPLVKAILEAVALNLNCHW